MALKCDDKGLLYDADTMKTLNKKDALKAWEHLHANRAILECFQQGLF